MQATAPGAQCKFIGEQRVLAGDGWGQSETDSLQDRAKEA